MSTITVVTRISPVNSEDLSHLLKPSELGKPVEVCKYSVTDPKTGLKYNVETTYCIGKSNIVENQTQSGLIPLTDSKCALKNIDEKNIDKGYAFSVPKKLAKDKVSHLFSPSKLKELENENSSQPHITLHLNLKKIREDKKQRSLSKKREKLVQPLFKYFINNECLICGVVLNKLTKTKILSHMSLHIKLGTYACQNCDNKCFPTAEALFSHSIKHAENKKYSCDMCDKKFERMYFLTVHRDKEHPNYIPKQTSAGTANLIKQKVPTCFVCTICKVKLISWKSLLNHKNAHSGKEGYLCLFCNKSFYTSSLLRYHSHIRIISKRFTCKFCHKTFSRTQRLREHEKVHSKKVQYKCKICEKKFNFRNSLTEHMQLLHS